MADNVRGRFLWYDLMTTDVEGAKAFYSELIGWGTESWDEGPEPYTMWTTDSGPVGGVAHLPEEAKAMGAPPHWMGYIGTPDVDATVADAVGKGAKVLGGPIDIPTVGRFTILADPQGAAFSAFTPETITPEKEPGVGDFSWSELMTLDHEAASDFYYPLFGWDTVDDVDMGPGGIYRLYGHQGKTLGGMFTLTPEIPMPPNWIYYVTVPNVDVVAETVVKLRGKVLYGPIDVPGGDRIVQCMDPQGAMFALHSVASP